MYLTDPLPTWTVELTAKVQQARVLTDLNIYPIQRWKLIGRCSWHGSQSIIVETTEFMTEDVLNGYVQCTSCLPNGVKRWCPIIQTKILKPDET